MDIYLISTVQNINLGYHTFKKKLFKRTSVFLLRRSPLSVCVCVLSIVSHVSFSHFVAKTKDFVVKMKDFWRR